MRTELYWIPTPSVGRLAIMPRPRGGDWLEDEIRAWRQVGVNVVVSLLTADEVADLDLAAEETLSTANGIHFLSFPIADRGLPSSREEFTAHVTAIGGRLARGESVAIHCRQGIGRAALVACCVLISSGLDAEDAIRHVSAAGGCSVPETVEQLRYVAAFDSRSLLR